MSDKLSNLDPAAALTGAELVYVVQAGVQKRSTVNEIVALALGGGATAELIRDAIGTALLAGAGVTVTVNDAGDTITIASTITQYTDEMARDALGAALVAGAGVTITVNDAGDTITIAASGGGGMSPITFKPYDSEPPASNYPQIDTRNNHPILAFDQTTVETVYFTGVLPNTYTGNGLTVDLDWCAVPTSGNVGWNVAIEAISGQDIDSDGFASDNAVAGVAVNGTSGIKSRSTVAITNGANMDSLAAGQPFRLRVKRDTSTGSNAAGDAQLLAVHIRET
jgi:hypothetical protein